MDEFGNLPKFENIEGMVTVARSRGIRFLFVLQSFSQLTAKYGKDIGDIIKTNCNVKIFIGSDDSETRKEFSELCGQKKIKNFSVNTNAENPASSNTGASNQPLITVGMLERLNGDEKGDAIVSVRGYEPIWTVFTPSYELKKIYFKEGKADISKREAVLFDKSEYVFDIDSKGQSIEDKLLDAIEEADYKVEKMEEDKALKLEELDRKWLAINDEIHKKLNDFVAILSGRDSKTVLSLALENKAVFLYSIMDAYNQSDAFRIRNMADFISRKTKELEELQAIATK